MAIGDVSASLTNPISFKSASFNGTSDEIYIKKEVLNVLADFSISFWIKRWATPVANDRIIDYQDAGPSNAFTIVCPAADNTIDIALRNSAGVTANHDLVVPFGEWHHIVLTATREGNSSISYLDSVVQESLVNGMTDSAVDLYIGRRAPTATNYPPMMIRDLRIFNVVLTPAEVTKLYNEQGVDRGLVAKYKFEGDATSDTGQFHGTASGVTYENDVQNLADTLKAARVGATDKYLVVDIGRGHEVISAVINES